MFKLAKPFFQADGAQGANPTDNSNGAAGDKPEAEKAGDDKDKGKQPGKVTFTAEQQAEVDHIVKERLERVQRKNETEAAKAKAILEEESLKKNSEFEKLANQRQEAIAKLEADIVQLSPHKEQAEKYRASMESLLKSQTDKLPKAMQELLAKLDPLDKMEFLATHAKDLNIEIKAVPESELSKDNNKLAAEVVDKARKDNMRLTKQLLGG